MQNPAARLFAEGALRSARQERSARRQEGHAVAAGSPSAGDESGRQQGHLVEAVKRRPDLPEGPASAVCSPVCVASCMIPLAAQRPASSPDNQRGPERPAVLGLVGCRGVEPLGGFAEGGDAADRRLVERDRGDAQDRAHLLVGELDVDARDQRPARLAPSRGRRPGPAPRSSPLAFWPASAWSDW